MARTRMTDSESAHFVADQLSTLIERRSPAKMKPTAQVAAEVEAMRRSRDWARATARHFVELYCWCHLHVYGLEPAELRGTGKSSVNARKGAISAAKRMLTTEFERTGQMAAFVDWAFKREIEREKWRAEQGRTDAPRLSWNALFAGRAVLTDYRASLLRKR